MDALLRGINEAKNTRVVGAITTDLVAEACRRHGLRGLDAVVLGRTLTAGCLLATLTKNDDERVRIEVRGTGAVGNVLVDARSDGTARGTMAASANANQDPKPEGWRTSVSGLIGNDGRIRVTRDVGLEQSYQGVIEIREGEIDLDLERYLAESEQLPSVLACEVDLDGAGKVRRAAGLLCQTFPDAPDHVLDPLRSFVRDGGLADLIRQDRTPEDVVGFALLGEGYEAMLRREISFHCGCGRQRALAVVSTLGLTDIEKLATEQENTTVTCSYCTDDYTLSAKDLRELAQQMRAAQS